MQVDTQTIPESQQTMIPVKVGQAFVDPTKTVTKYVFFCKGGPTNYYFANGRVGMFKPGTVPGYTDPAFVTDVKGYIDELTRQIVDGHPNFYQVDGMQTITEEQLDPLDYVKKAAVEVYKQQLLKEAESEEAKKLLNSMGVGTPEPSFTPGLQPSLKGILTSANVHAGMADSTSANEISGQSLQSANAAVETNKVNAPDVPSFNFGGLIK